MEVAQGDEGDVLSAMEDAHADSVKIMTLDTVRLCLKRVLCSPCGRSVYTLCTFDTDKSHINSIK